MNALGRNAILVIDSDPAIRALLLALLRRRGYAVDTAGSPEEALELHRDGRHAAVILDPRVEDGDELLHALQTGADDAPSRNVIVVTTPDESPALWARHPRVHAVLFKPFSLNHLTEVVAACCDGESS